MGETLPSVEVCGTPADEDCNGIAEPCAAAHHLWSHRYGDALPQLAGAVAVDGKGDVILGGAFAGTVDFGGSVQTAGAPGQVGAFIAELDSSGTTQKSWGFGAAPVPGFSFTSVTSVAITGAQEIVAAGSLLGKLDIGSVHLANDGFEDGFVVKLAVDGTPAWGRSFSANGMAGSAVVTSLAIDPTDNIVVTGRFGGTVDFGGTNLTANGGNNDLFLAKLSSAGDVLWVERFGSSAGEDSALVAVAPDGTVVLATSSLMPIDFGDGAPAGLGGFDVRVAAFSGADGGLVWSKLFGGPSFNDAPTSLAVRADGSILLAGIFAETAELGGFMLTSAGGIDIFVVQMDANGTPTRALSLGGAGDDVGARARADAGGNLFVAGSVGAPFSLGSSDLVGPGIFLARLSPDGTPVWAESYGDMMSQPIVVDLALDPQGNVLVTGTTDGDLDLGGGPLPMGGNKDLFVAKMAP
jgi:hypothetical protein